MCLHLELIPQPYNSACCHHLGQESLTGGWGTTTTWNLAHHLCYAKTGLSRAWALTKLHLKLVMVSSWCTPKGLSCSRGAKQEQTVLVELDCDWYHVIAKGQDSKDWYNSNALLWWIGRSRPSSRLAFWMRYAPELGCGREKRLRPPETPLQLTKVPRTNWTDESITFMQVAHLCAKRTSWWICFWLRLCTSTGTSQNQKPHFLDQEGKQSLMRRLPLGPPGVHTALPKNFLVQPRWNWLRQSISWNVFRVHDVVVFPDKDKTRT